ncbi:hypothetical protein TNCV_4461051 [Trichonephila clavipes]|nr:hypothetical protein TNCV_4461051 [Trichonephila clavipes]
MPARVTVEYPAYQGKSEQDMAHGVLHYLVGRGHLANLKDRAQPLDIRIRSFEHCMQRHCAIPVSSFVVRRIRVAISLYVALSREAKPQC